MEFLWLVFDDFEEGTGTHIDHVFFDCMLLMQLKKARLSLTVITAHWSLNERNQASLHLFRSKASSIPFSPWAPRLMKTFVRLASFATMQWKA